VERKKDVGEKRTRDGVRRDVNVGGRKALFNSKTPSHATTPLKEGREKSLPTPEDFQWSYFCRRHEACTVSPRTWHPALPPSHSAVISVTREKDI
jgi:hypothetical protein